MEKYTFPQIGQKHKFTPLFSAKRATEGRRKIPKKAIFIYSKRLGDILKRELSLKPYRHEIGTDGGISKAHTYITKDGKMLVVGLPIGAPLTGVTAEEAIACSTKEILILGTAGTMSDSLEISDVILCDRAIRDEGVSHHYLKSSKYVKPDKSLTKKLGAAMTRAGIKFVFGTTWTIDAPYMETKEEICSRKN
ncbi:MAG: hypothetical protein QW774_03025 [Candidatus Micrarchaeaceae archaeon]